MFGANEAKAAPFLWSSYQDIVPTTNPSNGNPISSTSYTSSSTVGAPNNLSAVYFIVTSLGLAKPVGGFDVRNGQVSSSSFNSYGAYYGLWEGDTANSAEGSNTQNHYPGGYWEVFYDKDGNGNYGLADNEIGGVFLDGSESVSSSNYNVSNFSAYNPLASGTFDFSTTVPEPTTSALLALGLSAVALRRRKPVFKQSSKYHK
jgi:hypothetical protein